MKTLYIAVLGVITVVMQSAFGQNSIIYPTYPGTTVCDYSKPGFKIEKQDNRIIAHPTFPGTTVRDYSKSGVIIEKRGNTIVAYPTSPGTSVEDFTRPRITMRSRNQNIINSMIDSDKKFSGLSTTYSTKPKAPSATFPNVTGINRYHPDSLANPYGAGSPYKPDGLMNPYSQYGSPYSNKSWRNPYATDPPKLYDSDGNYRGKLSVNPYDPDSVSNPYGRYGSPYSPDSINNPYGAGNPYSMKPIYVVPSR